MVKIDIGCGPNKAEGFVGLDSREFPGVDHVVRVGVDPLPFEDSSVDEARASHFVEHLTGEQRIQFVNELHRVLKPGAKAQIIVPHWASSRAYGDLTHQWPPVVEMWFYYLNAEWRSKNAPHNDGYTCDFDSTWGYALHPAVSTRNQEYQNYAVSFLKEAAQDLIATIVKRG